MTARQIRTFRSHLEAKQSDLEQRIQLMRDRLAIERLGDTPDRVPVIHERESAARAIAFEIRLLRQVKGALGEIAAGTFGRCAGCDEDIPARRLKAVPWSPYCLLCQEKAEGPSPLRAPALAQTG
ncbi:MAG: TraR/DksA C4-type zinc finger protein [Candidatus Solibacter sp.]